MYRPFEPLPDGTDRLAEPIRLGLSPLFVGPFFQAPTTERLADVIIHTCSSIDLTRRLIRGEIDVACILDNTELTNDLSRLVVAEMAMEFVWAHGRHFVLRPGEPIPLLTWPRGDVMTETLDRQGRTYRIVFNSPSYHEKLVALEAGLGMTALPKRLIPASLVVADAYDLPPLPPLRALLCVRSDLRSAGSRELLADISARFFTPCSCKC